MKSSTSRRTFFGAVGAAASLAAIAAAKKPVAAPAVAAPTLGKTPAQTGYQLSEHVKRYYRSTVA